MNNYTMHNYPIKPEWSAAQAVIHGDIGAAQLQIFDSDFTHIRYELFEAESDNSVLLKVDTRALINEQYVLDYFDKEFDNVNEAKRWVGGHENNALKHYLIERGEWIDPDGVKMGEGRL